MISGPFEYTPSGKKKAPTRNLVLRWVNETWREIPAEMVMKSFRTCGISNALDGTMRRDRRSTMTRTTSSRLSAKARVTQMVSELYCQLKTLYKMAPLRATNSIKVQ